LGMSMAFLEEALLSEQTLSTGEFNLYTPETQSQLEYMVLDSQALQHLEVVETATGKVEGSLFHYVDNCKTPFAKRLLKRWLLSPLMNINKINDRLDAVEDLIKHQYETDVFRSKLAKLPDLERLLAKLYTYSVKHKVKAIYFENVSLNKLKEFRVVLRHFKTLAELVSSLKNKVSSFKSQRLWALLTEEEAGGLFPEGIQDVIAEFEKMIVWKRTQGGEEEIPEPQTGIDENFDRQNAIVDDIKARLEAVLQKTR
jgi:DNA mismatch repair protein MSH6